MITRSGMNARVKLAYDVGIGPVSHTLTTYLANHRRIDRCAQLIKIIEMRQKLPCVSLLIAKYVRNLFYLEVIVK